jgi:hypothetical protein
MGICVCVMRQLETITRKASLAVVCLEREALDSILDQSVACPICGVSRVYTALS